MTESACTIGKKRASYINWNAIPMCHKALADNVDVIKSTREGYCIISNWVGVILISYERDSFHLEFHLLPQVNEKECESSSSCKCCDQES